MVNQSSEGDSESINPDFIDDLWNMFDIYSDSKYLEKRIRFNLWTNGQFDNLMADYHKNTNDLKKSFIEVAKRTVTNLSETTKNAHKETIEKFNNSVTEEDIMNSALRLVGQLSFSSKIFRSLSNVNYLQAILKPKN